MKAYNIKCTAFPDYGFWIELFKPQQSTIVDFSNLTAIDINDAQKLIKDGLKLLFPRAKQIRFVIHDIIEREVNL